MTGEDRFGDLGTGGRSAAERFAELDEREPEQVPEPPKPPRPSSRYSWVVGIAFLIAIAVAGLNAIRSEGPDVSSGGIAPLFVAPLATTGLDRDANTDNVCSIRLPDTVNLCHLRDRPVVLTFFFTRFADCGPQMDRVEQVSRRVRDVTFVGVIVRSSKGDAAELVRDHHWSFPVVLDRDGLVSNVYGIKGCPTTIFIRPGGRIAATRLGEVGAAELARRARGIAG